MSCTDDALRLQHAVVVTARRLARERHAGLTPMQVSLLGSLDAEQVTVGELARRHGVRPPTVSRFLTWALSEGLVHRAPNPSDRRSRLYSASPRATALLRTARARHDRWLDGGMATLTAPELATLRSAGALLEQLATS